MIAWLAIVAVSKLIDIMPAPRQTPWASLCTVVCASVLLIACTVNPPVQEMSNARQTIQAAQEVQAAVYAPEALREAEALLQLATGALETGDYAAAREHALAAQQQAVKARQQALSNQRN